MKNWKYSWSYTVSWVQSGLLQPDFSWTMVMAREQEVLFSLVHRFLLAVVFSPVAFFTCCYPFIIWYFVSCHVKIIALIASVEGPEFMTWYFWVYFSILRIVFEKYHWLPSMPCLSSFPLISFNWQPDLSQVHLPMLSAIVYFSWRYQVRFHQIAVFGVSYQFLIWEYRAV